MVHDHLSFKLKVKRMPHKKNKKNKKNNSLYILLDIKLIICVICQHEPMKKTDNFDMCDKANGY